MSLEFPAANGASIAHPPREGSGDRKTESTPGQEEPKQSSVFWTRTAALMSSQLLWLPAHNPNTVTSSTF